MPPQGCVTESWSGMTCNNRAAVQAWLGMCQAKISRHIQAEQKLHSQQAGRLTDQSTAAMKRRRLSVIVGPPLSSCHFWRRSASIMSMACAAWSRASITWRPRSSILGEFGWGAGAEGAGGDADEDRNCKCSIQHRAAAIGLSGAFHVECCRPAWRGHPKQTRWAPSVDQQTTP